MELSNSFIVDVGIDRAWQVLTDVPAIAPCLPGAQLQDVEGDDYTGIVKVKVGPIVAQYKGKATFVEQNETDHRLVLRADGRETRGQGSASALITARLESRGEKTEVLVDTELTVSGKVAQFGRGVMADVSAKLMDEFAENLASTVLGDSGDRATSESDAATTSGQPAAVSGNGAAATSTEPSTSSPTSGPTAEPEPIDLLATAGVPAARRFLPPIIAAVAGVAGDPVRRSPPARLKPGVGMAGDPHGVGAADQLAVAELLGREPRARFEVVVRKESGEPMVIRNAPLLDDGTPMPTRYYLVDRELNSRVGTLEAAGGVRRAEAEVGLEAIEATHSRYAAERDAAIPEGWDGPRPSGGVGGTRRGVKCLHAHYAHHLAGGPDPVGEWVQRQLREAATADQDDGIGRPIGDAK